MSDLIDTLAAEAVAAFRAELAATADQSIGEAQFDRLRLLVAEAVGVALRHAAEQVDGLAQALRREAESGAEEIEL